jgi:hypothetical protein
MELLEVFTLSGYSKLDKFPDIVGNMNCLRELRLDGTAIAELSSSFHCLAGLVLLSMNSCRNLESIPSSISGLKSLKRLDVSDCSELKNIPENLGEVESLEEFDASGTSIRQLPASFFLLKNLRVLSFNGCKRVAVNLTDQVVPSLSSLCSLEELDLRACKLREGAVPEDIGCLSSLRSLNLSRNNFISLPKSINQLSRLEKCWNIANYVTVIVKEDGYHCQRRWLPCETQRGLLVQHLQPLDIVKEGGYNGGSQQPLSNVKVW